MRKRSMSNLMAAALLIAGIGFLSAVSAQPTDAQIKKDLTGPKTVSVVLGKPGTREWSSTYNKYVWNMGNYHFNRLIGKVESIALSDEPGFQWHTPNSVSFNVTAVYTERTNDVGGRERRARTFEIRLYRDNPKQGWLRMMSTAREKKIL